MRIGIVGAGVSGLAAARFLQAAGSEVVVFERAEAPGGRVATVSKSGFTFDSGATSIAPRGMTIEGVMLEELPTDELRPVTKPIYLHTGLRVMPGDHDKNLAPRYTYRGGNATLAKLLAEGLNVRLGVSIDSLSRAGQGFEMRGESLDAVILTPPVPQTSAILWSLEESRPLANARYRSCLSVMLGFERALPNLGYHALLDPEQRHPLTWLSIESQKCEGRAPAGGTAVVAQMSPAYSFNFWTQEDEEIIRDVLVYLGRLYGEETLGKPVVQIIKRWKYSQPDSVALFDSVNIPGAKLVIAGDGLSAGRVESAFESGVRAARFLLDGARS